MKNSIDNGGKLDQEFEQIGADFLIFKNNYLRKVGVVRYFLTSDNKLWQLFNEMEISKYGK